MGVIHGEQHIQIVIVPFQMQFVPAIPGAINICSKWSYQICYSPGALGKKFAGRKPHKTSASCHTVWYAHQILRLEPGSLMSHKSIICRWVDLASLWNG